MPTWGWVLLVIVAFIGGLVAGFFLSRRTLDKYLAENPPFNEQMIAQMLSSMGQKPSQKRVNQIMSSMTQASKKK